MRRHPFAMSPPLPPPPLLFLLLLLFFLPPWAAVSAQRRVAFSAVEEAANGTVIGNLRDALLLSQAFGAAELALTSFRFLSAPPFLALNPHTADVSLNGRLDREALCPALAVCCDGADCVVPVQVAVVASRGDAAAPDFVLVDVAVVDINDHAPSWSTPEISLSVPEHTVPGFRLRLPLPRDPDRAPDNTTAHFSLLAPDPDSGKLVPAKGFALATDIDSSGTFTTLWLQIDRVLDRERRAFHRLVVQAADGGSPPAVGSVAINLTVSDINDQPPWFLEKEPRASISENAPRGQFVLRLRATDDDPSDRRKLQFKFGSAVRQQVRDMFDVERESGVVRLIGRVDYERRRSYTFPVAVTDGRHSAETTARISVINVNDNDPEVVVQSLTEQNGSIWLRENAGRQMLATVSVSDRDDPRKVEDIVCTVDDPSFSLSKLYAGARFEMALYARQSFDRESQPAFAPSVICVDGGQPRRTAVVPLQIVVEDVNDNPPRLTAPTGIVHFPENQPTGSLVLKAVGTDLDVGINARLIYSLDAASQRAFRINEFNGELRTLGPFDREVLASLNVTVTVRDSGGASGALSSSRAFEIAIDDVNDCRPVFAQSRYDFAVTEGQRINNVVGQVHASDADIAAKNRRISYKLSVEGPRENGSAGAFRVTPDGSILVNRETIDRERQPVYKLIVTAVDHGVPPLSGTTRVIIGVRDLNDNAPVWRFPIPTNNSINASWHTVVGFELGGLQAWDPDAGPYGEVEYRIVSGNEAGTFDVDHKSGAIYLSRSLNQETTRLYKLVVAAQDRGRPAMESLSVLNIIVHEERQAVQGQTSPLMSFEATVLSVLVAGTFLVAMFLLLAIFLIRCRRNGRKKNRRKGGSLAGHSRQSLARSACRDEGEAFFARHQLDYLSVRSSSEISGKSEEKVHLRDSESVDSGQGRSSDARSTIHGANAVTTELPSTFARCPSSLTTDSGCGSGEVGSALRGRRRLAASNAYESFVQIASLRRPPPPDSPDIKVTSIV